MSAIPLDKEHLSSIAEKLAEVKASEGIDQHQRLYIVLEKSTTGIINLTTTMDETEATPLNEVASTIELFTRQLLERTERTGTPLSSASSSSNHFECLEISNNSLISVINQIKPLYSNIFSQTAPSALLLEKLQEEAFLKVVTSGDLKTIETLVQHHKELVRSLIISAMTQGDMPFLTSIANIPEADLRSRIFNLLLEEGMLTAAPYYHPITSPAHSLEVMELIRLVIEDEGFINILCKHNQTISVIEIQHRGSKEHFRLIMSYIWNVPRLKKNLLSNLFPRLNRTEPLNTRFNKWIRAYNRAEFWGFAPLIEHAAKLICKSFNIDLEFLNFLNLNQEKLKNIDEGFLEEIFDLLSRRQENIASSLHVLCAFPNFKDLILADKLPQIWRLTIDWQHCPEALSSLFGNCSPLQIQEIIQKFSKESKINLIEACEMARQGLKEGYTRAKHELTFAEEFAKKTLRTSREIAALVEAGASSLYEVDLVPMNLQEALEKAFLAGNPTTCRWLLSKGANINGLHSQINPELFQWLSSFVNAPELSPKHLDFFALQQGMGYKSANLMVLDQAATRLNREGVVKATVPQFLPISNREIHYHLRQFYPSLNEEWNAFLDTFPQDQIERFCTEPSSFDGLALTEAGKAILQKIQDNITHVFNEHPFDSPLIQEWLEKNEAYKLIVRSTGKEDSEALANAGGNLSIPCVQPDLKSVSHAIGAVVASYFSQISLSQRLMSGDTSLFEEKDPFMPVLIQAMVMEDKNEGAPSLRSGVAFSSPLPSVPHLMKLQVAYGNNQGVVEGSVAVDTFQVLQDDIRLIIRDKKERYTHEEDDEGNVVLCKTPNEQELISIAALPKDIVQAVARFINDLAYYYGQDGQRKSLDIEFSIKYDPISEKYILYLLQTRPLATPRDEAESASYLDPTVLQQLSQEHPNDIVRGDVLLAGSSSCQTVTASEELIIATDLFNALKAYLASDHKSKVKAIICFKNASETSHPAVEFRATGLPVIILQASSKNRVEELLLQVSLENPLIVSVQNREVLVATRNLSEEQKGLIEKNGMVTFPGILAVSLPEGNDLLNAVESEGPQALKSLFEHVNSIYPELKDKLLAGHALLSTGKVGGYGPQQLLQIIATGNPEQVKQALATLLFLLHSTLNKSVRESGKEKVEIIAVTEMLLAFSKILKHCEYKLLPLLEHPSKDSQMEFLYHLQFVKALVFQRRDEAVNAFSFHSALEIQQTDLESSANSDMGQVLILYKKKATSTSIAMHWEEFILRVQETSSAHIPKLYEMLKDLDSLDLSRLWINILFKDSIDEDVGQFIDSQEALLQQDSSTLEWIREQDHALNRFSANVDEWSSPDVYESQVDAFIHEFSVWFSNFGGALKQHYENTEKGMARLAILQFMQRGIIVYDKAIKAVTGSTEFTQAHKLEAFANLLIPYRNMMETCLKLIPRKQSDELWLIPQYKWLSRTTEKYLKEINEGIVITKGHKQSIEGFYKLTHLALSNQCTTEQFSIRPHFSVQPMIIGSKACLVDGVIWPERLEEYFTIFHQNMVTAIDILMNENGLTEEVLETTQRDFLTMMIEMDDSPIAKATTCVYFKENQVNLRINVPLGAHALTFDISYVPLKPEKGWQVDIKMYGFNEDSRWETAAKVLALFPEFVDGVTLVTSSEPIEADTQFFEAAICIASSFNSDKMDILAELFVEFADALLYGFESDEFFGKAI